MMTAVILEQKEWIMGGKMFGLYDATVTVSWLDEMLAEVENTNQ